MARVSSEQVNRTRVQTWAAWRREGKSYDEITALDTLEPSYPTIKKYLEHYGFDGDGQPLNGNGANGHVPAPAPVAERPSDIPKGWGKVETNVISPNSAMTSSYAPLLEYVGRVATSSWARIEAPGKSQSSTLMKYIRKHLEGIESKSRTLSGKNYVYFRLKKDGDA